MRNNEQDAKQKTTRANGLKAIEVPTACVFQVLAMGRFGRASGVLGAPSGSSSAGFGRSWDVLKGSPGLLEGPRGNPRASREPWQGPTGAPGVY